RPCRLVPLQLLQPPEPVTAKPHSCRVVRTTPETRAGTSHHPWAFPPAPASGTPHGWHCGVHQNPEPLPRHHPDTRMREGIPPVPCSPHHASGTPHNERSCRTSSSSPDCRETLTPAGKARLSVPGHYRGGTGGKACRERGLSRRTLKAETRCRHSTSAVTPLQHVPAQLPCRRTSPVPWHDTVRAKPLCRLTPVPSPWPRMPACGVSPHSLHQLSRGSNRPLQCAGCARQARDQNP